MAGWEQCGFFRFCFHSGGFASFQQVCGCSKLFRSLCVLLCVCPMLAELALLMTRARPGELRTSFGTTAIIASVSSYHAQLASSLLAEM